MVTLDQLRNHFLVESGFEDFRSQTIVDPKQKIITRDSSKCIKEIVFHCADEEGWSPLRLSQFFVYERKFPICAYHYYVTDTNVWHMVGENILTYHAAPYNSDSVAFSIDYFATRDDKLNIAIKPALMENAIRTAAFLCMKFRVLPKDLHGHRELWQTGWIGKDAQDHPILRKTCPGLAIDLDQFRLEVGRRIQNAINQLYGSEIKGLLAVDGIVGPKTIAAYEFLERY